MSIEISCKLIIPLFVFSSHSFIDWLRCACNSGGFITFANSAPKQNTALLSHVFMYVRHRHDNSTFLNTLMVYQTRHTIFFHCISSRLTTLTTLTSQTSQTTLTTVTTLTNWTIDGLDHVHHIFSECISSRLTTLTTLSSLGLPGPL